MNLSHNTVSQYSALTCFPSTSKNEDNNIGTSVTYSSFADNNATSQCCILLNYFYYWSSSTIEHNICNSNIIRNIGKNTIRNEYGTTTIQNCTIMENKGSPVFSGSITLIKCAVSDDQYKDATNLNTGKVLTNSFINGLTFIQTGSCVNIFDTIGSLIPSNMPTMTTKPSSGNRDVACQFDDYLPIRKRDLFQLLEYIFLLCFLPVC